jgi:hypothetical protein
MTDECGSGVLVTAAVHLREQVQEKDSVHFAINTVATLTQGEARHSGSTGDPPANHAAVDDPAVGKTRGPPMATASSLPPQNYPLYEDRPEAIEALVGGYGPALGACRT